MDSEREMSSRPAKRRRITPFLSDDLSTSTRNLDHLERLLPLHSSSQNTRGKETTNDDIVETSDVEELLTLDDIDGVSPRNSPVYPSSGFAHERNASFNESLHSIDSPDTPQHTNLPLRSMPSTTPVLPLSSLADSPPVSSDIGSVVEEAHDAPEEIQVRGLGQNTFSQHVASNGGSDGPRTKMSGEYLHPDTRHRIAQPTTSFENDQEALFSLHSPILQQQPRPSFHYSRTLSQIPPAEEHENRSRTSGGISMVDRSSQSRLSEREQTQRSPSLSPPPPSPPRRRTRETNKLFAPYTAYKRQWGDAELRRLEALEARKHVQRHTYDPEKAPGDDSAWVESQSQLEGESQALWVQTVHHRTASKGIVTSTSSRSRHSNHDTPRQRTKDRTNAKPDGSAPDPPRALVNSTEGNPLNEAIHRPDSSTARYEGVEAHRPQPRASSAMIQEALRKLYEDSDSSNDQQDPFPIGDRDYHRNAGDRHLSEGTAHDPETSESMVDDHSDEGNRSEEKRLSPSRIQLSAGEAAQSDEETEESDIESEDEVDRRRQRILGRVWPAVMIKKKAEEARKKELERQRKRRDDERARRRALGLSDSDASDNSTGLNSLLPGQSKTTRIADGNPIMIIRTPSPTPSSRSENGHAPQMDLIDLTSDRESLDNDDAVDINEVHSVSDDDLDLTMSTPRHLGRYKPDTEAIEDNRLNRGGGSRVSISIRDNTKPRRKRSNTWMFQDGRVKPRQSRIDHILNASRGPNSSRRKHRRSGDARHPAEHRNTARSSIGEGTSARREKRHRLVQAKLPFDRLSEGSENLSGDSFELRKRNQHKSKSRPSASIHKHRRTTKSMPSGVTVTLRSTTEKPLELFDIFTPAATHSTTATTSGRQVSRPQQTTSKRPPPNTSAHFARPSTKVVESRGNFEDPDSFVEISLRSALAFGMRRSREGFHLPETSWIGQGRILDLVNLLSQQTVPIQPYPCHIVGIRLDASLPVADFQLHIPTICDLLFENATKPSQSNDEGDSTLNDLTRFVCSYVSWSVTRAEDDTDQILLYIRSQLSMLMERVEEYCHLRGLSGLGFDRRLFGIHWFAVELSNRIALARVAIKGESMDEIVLKDATSDQFSVNLMARLLEFGIRKTATAFSLGAPSSSTIERYTLELWLALIHVTFLHPCNLDGQASASFTFWRLVMDSLDQSNRHFPSVIHEAEFIFSVIFFLSSISSISPLGVGRNERLLKAYWPIVCRALALLNLSPEVDERRKPSQATLAAKDTYLGMLFARCNVLVFRWDWSLQDNSGFRQLVEILRGALKNRKFMNLLHEQSEFPRFITQRNLDLLRQFDAKDSIQTILIKLIFQKVEDSQEGKQAARKWVSLLASTTTLEFTKEKPPTQKELSALFNQFTIKFILLHTNPDLNNIRTIINSSKKIVDFQSADQRSRQICIRAAMIFGRFCRHYTLPIQDVSIWISEMGHILLAEYNAARREGSAFQLKEITTMCALIVASLRDIFQSRAMDSDQTPLPATFPEASTCIFDVISKLLAAFREIDQCLSEVGLLLKCILDLRTHFFPDPPTPPFTREVNEEESQEDYGFDPINVNDLSLAEVMMLDGNEGSTRPYWDEDLDLAKSICELINAITSAISRIAYLDDGVKKRKDVELWVEIWANVAILCTAHNLKQWDYFLHRTPVSLGRLGDLAWRQVAEPLFLLHVLSGDPKAYNVDREIFSKCWFLSMAADPQHIIPSYTFVLFHVDGLKSPLWEGIPFPRGMSEEEYEDVFAEQRQLLIESVLHNLERHYQAMKGGDNTTTAVVSEGMNGLSELLNLMRHNVMRKAKAPNNNALREYFQYCSEVVGTIHSLNIGGDSRIAPYLADPWVNQATAWLRAE